MGYLMIRVALIKPRAVHLYGKCALIPGLV
jgi:hypothetical protein